MSLQIRKVLGYALTDLVDNDPRVNWQSALVGDPDAALSFNDFADHLESLDRHLSERFNVDTVRLQGDAHPHRRVGECVVHPLDQGLSSVLVIVPPSYADEWIQKDNIFDYVEAHLAEEPNTEPSVRDVRGIYPYDGLWMDKATGLELHPGQVSRFFRMIEQNADPLQLLAAARRITPFSPWEDADDPAEPLFKDAGAVADRLARFVPYEVRELASFGELFTDPDIWKTLRPVLYTYWA